MADKLMIVMANTDPQNAAELGMATLDEDGLLKLLDERLER